MEPLKLRQLVSVLIFHSYFYGFTTSVEFEPCFPAIKNQPCNMTCKVPNLSQTVEFYCNTTSRGACVPGIFCNPSIETEGGNTLYFKIPSLSYASDNCDWTCLDGTVTSSVSNPTIFSGFSSDLILTNQTNEDKINLTATAECVYPYNTSVRVQYREEQDASEKYQYLTQQVDVQSFHVPGNCGNDIENSIVATYEVSRKHSLLGGKSVVLRMEFLQYISATPNYTTEVGPFTFVKSSDSEGCKYSDAELFLGGFSCFLIVFGITSIIMLIFLLCQMLPKIFEDKKTNKIIFIVVFNSFALIFGFALGFGLKECEKRDLGLGLGLGFGFILAIALFLTLYIYHKQCGSKKENEDENRKKPEDHTQRVGSPASTSNIKMESKLKS